MSELQTELKKELRRFCREKIKPFVEEDESKDYFRKETYRELGQLGFCGVTVPEKYGGAGLSMQDFCAVLSEIAKFSVSYAVTTSVSTMVQKILCDFGSEEQKSKYLPPLAAGQEIGAFSLSESHSGSDAASLQATAKLKNNNYLLNGNKMWITSGGIAKTYIVMARTGEKKDGSAGISAFIVQDGTPGLKFGKKEKKMGWKTSPTSEMILENCEIPRENLLQEEGLGFKIAMQALDKGRITIGAIANGLSSAALEVAGRYALTRQQFKKPIFDFQGLQFMLADMATEIEASQLLVTQAALLYDQGRPDNKLASMAKLKSTDTAMKVTTDALQILGGVGYTSEYPVERMMRDAKALQIVEGTNQIQRVVIARALKKEYSQ